MIKNLYIKRVFWVNIYKILILIIINIYKWDNIIIIFGMVVW